MEKILEVKGLSAGYGKKAILQAADFTVYAGEMIGIIGANGSGKSTLLKTLRGLLPPLRGHILYTGQDLQGLRAGGLFPACRLSAAAVSVSFWLYSGGNRYDRAVSLSFLVAAGRRAGSVDCAVQYGIHGCR